MHLLYININTHTPFSVHLTYFVVFSYMMLEIFFLLHGSLNVLSHHCKRLFVPNVMDYLKLHFNNKNTIMPPMENTCNTTCEISQLLRFVGCIYFHKVLYVLLFLKNKDYSS